MIKKLAKPEVVEPKDEKVVPFDEGGCGVMIGKLYADEEIDDITF
jgi:hypothetical protein